MPLIARAEHPLGHVAAAARLRAGIPGGPPVQSDVHAERDERHPGGVQVGNEVERATAAGRDESRLHGPDAAHRAHREDRQHDHHAHLDDELEQVGDQHAPQSGERRDEGSDGDDAEDDEQRVEFGYSQHQHQELHHRQIDPAQHDAVDGNAEIERAKAAQEGRRSARIADLGELDVGHHPGAPPQPRVEEDREHPARHEAPPQPVARDAAPGHQAGHHQRRIGGEGGGHHRGARQPPRHVPAGEEELGDVLPGAGLVVKPDGQIEHEVQADHGPIERSELHLEIIAEALGRKDDYLAAIE